LKEITVSAVFSVATIMLLDLLVFKQPYSFPHDPKKDLDRLLVVSQTGLFAMNRENGFAGALGDYLLEAIKEMR
jgi:hypothetical protein